MVPFKAVSLSHELAPVEIRELIYLPEADCQSLLLSLKEGLGLEEAMVFSTCNRTEIYYVSEEDLSLEVIKLLAIHKGVGHPVEYVRYFRVINEEKEAIRYLFEVAMGLHSQVLGDLQISSQVKQAYAWSHDQSMAGAFLHRLLHTIFHANKRVHQETPFRDGAASVSYAAAELAVELTASLKAPSVLVVGLGEMGTDVARSLDPEKFDSVTLCNRTLAKTEALARETGAQVLPFEQFAAKVREYDMVISAVSVEDPMIVPEMYAGAGIRPRYVLDLCVPRSVAPEFEALPQVVLFNVDDIHSRTSRALALRKEAIPDVQRIIEEEMLGFLEWRQQLSISPTIHKIKEALEQIRKEEVARFLKNANEQERDLLESVTRSMINKVLKLPVLHLKDACKRGEAEELMELLHDLFDLERKKKA